MQGREHCSHPCGCTKDLSPTTVVTFVTSICLLLVNIFLDRTIQTYFFTLVVKTTLALQHKHLVVCSKTLAIIGQLVPIINGRPFDCNGEMLLGLEVRGFGGGPGDKFKQVSI